MEEISIPKNNLKTSIVFIIFNRPDTTDKVFEAIRQAQPPKLLVIADGPRLNRPGEAEKCTATRAIINRVDWNCEVLTNYSEINLGCKKRVSSGLDWVFNNVEEAIILEDDCLPDASFFTFCEEMLERYRHDERVMTICGSNHGLSSKNYEYSYYFSRYFRCWGWASWRRAWQHYDVNMKLFPEVLDKGVLNHILLKPREINYWQKIFQSLYNNKFDTWDYQFIFACWLQSGLSVIPTRNLITNIGFGKEATHTTNQDSEYANLFVEPMVFPLHHPPYVIRNIAADEFIQETLFNPSFATRAKSKLRGFFKKSVK